MCHVLFNFSLSNKFIIVLFCISYSILIEILQIFTLRGFQISDIIFNLIGILISFLFLKIFIKKKL